MVGLHLCILQNAGLNDVIPTGDLATVNFTDDVYLENDTAILLLSTSALRTIAEIAGIEKVQF